MFNNRHLRMCSAADIKAISILDTEVKIENNQAIRKSTTIATVKYHPTSSMYVVRGRIRYWDVEGSAYLEMWSAMPDGNRYFSRTLSENGPMQKIQKTSDWRTFELPFNLMDAKPESVTLEINVVMPGKGKIEVAGLTVGDWQMGKQLAEEGQAWWSERTGGLIGGLLGSVIGIFGGVFGTICGFLVQRGKGKRWILGMIYSSIAVGAVLLIGGLAALCIGQPYHVWYPLLLCGGIMSIVFVCILPGIYCGYARAERRRMEALDI